jgi:hypothetical protein
VRSLRSFLLNGVVQEAVVGRLVHLWGIRSASDGEVDLCRTRCNEAATGRFHDFGMVEPEVAT